MKTKIRLGLRESDENLQRFDKIFIKLPYYRVGNNKLQTSDLTKTHLS